MGCEMIPFTPVEEHTPTEEDHCSFCGVDKSNALKGRLVKGPEAMLCIRCLRQMSAMLTADDGGLVA